MRRRFVLLVFVVVVSCDRAPDSPPFVVRDSAGIRIVENTNPLWQPGQEWRLSPEPVVDIGGGETEEQQLFRVAGALRLGNDRIAIADGGSMELRFYDSNGGHEKSVGGRGEGPGEFQGGAFGRARLGGCLGRSFLLYPCRKLRRWG